MELSNNLITKYFPFLKNTIYGFEAWYWAFLIISILVAFLLGSILKKPISSIVAYFSKRDDRLDKLLVVEKLQGPIHALIALFFFILAHLIVKQPEKTADGDVSIAIKLALFLSFAYLGYRVIDLAFSRLVRQYQNERSRIGLVLPLGRRVSKTLLIVLAALMILSILGVDVSALIVGLGVGGLAIALAAQKILENLFGGAVLSLDQPFQVGDYCKCGDILGYIEEIGLRSTRIRTLDRTLVSVPNSQLSEMHIENYAEREKIRLYTTLYIDLMTPLVEVKELLSEFERILIEDENFYTNTYRIRLIGLSESGYEIEIYAFAKCTEQSEFIRGREALLFAYKEKMEELGVSLAVPYRKSYVSSQI